MVAVSAPASLHEVALGGAGGKTGGGTHALDVHHHHGDLGLGGVADVLLLQGEARAGGGGHGLDAGHGSADGGGGAGDLVLHLEEAAAHLGQLLSGDLSDLGGGRDGVSGEEPHTGGDGAHDAGFVALH